MENNTQQRLFDVETVAVSKQKTRFGDYQSFVEKFKDKKTTDDCYTPAPVYDAVVKWLIDEGLIEKEARIIRPFYPGNDFTKFDYPKGSVVVDNPPFSIYSFICRWFARNGIKFFLFGPQLTLIVDIVGVCFLPVTANIVYENGAKVSTGFATNLINGLKLWTAPSLRKAIHAALPKNTKKLSKIKFPLNVISSAHAGKYATAGVDLKIREAGCCVIKKCGGKQIFGSALLLSEREVAEREVAKREVAEREVAERVELSEKEYELLRQLDKQQCQREKEQYTAR